MNKLAMLALCDVIVRNMGSVVAQGDSVGAIIRPICIFVASVEEFHSGAIHQSEIQCRLYLSDAIDFGAV